MWRRAYWLLLVVRIYFAFAPSYLHPDENFQGPEVLAGRIFSYPAHLTWEFTSGHPIRSIFPLWPAYGLPMTLLKYGWTDGTEGAVPPKAIYYVLRAIMFLLSFVLEDWAIQELVPSPRHRREAVLLVASSYVTWTYQTHTFSNSLETLLVLWSLVLIDRIVENKQRSSPFASSILGFLIVVGVFNRITFPAFLLLPGLSLLPHFCNKPLSLIFLLLSTGFFTALAITTDTAFYGSNPLTLSDLLQHPTITPINNLLYNFDTTNLALHGLHPHHQHFLVNLPQLLGPALVLVGPLSKSPGWHKTPALLSALSATTLLSFFPHQEPRFLIPCIPLLLTCIRVPPTWLLKTIPGRTFMVSWLLFNATLGLLMGSYHQAGVIPTQIHLRSSLLPQPPPCTPALAFWWKTYPPPTYLAQNASLLDTRDLAGMPFSAVADEMSQYAYNCHSPLPQMLRSNPAAVFLIAPLAATQLDALTASTGAAPLEGPANDLVLTEVWRYEKHIGFDDLDPGEKGLWNELKRVIGRRGLGVWRVSWKRCD